MKEAETEVHRGKPVTLVWGWNRVALAEPIALEGGRDGIGIW